MNFLIAMKSEELNLNGFQYELLKIVSMKRFLTISEIWEETFKSIYFCHLIKKDMKECLEDLVDKRILLRKYDFIKRETSYKKAINVETNV